MSEPQESQKCRNCGYDLNDNLCPRCKVRTGLLSSDTKKGIQRSIILVIGLLAVIGLFVVSEMNSPFTDDEYARIGGMRQWCEAAKSMPVVNASDAEAQKLVEQLESEVIGISDSEDLEKVFKKYELLKSILIYQADAEAFRVRLKRYVSGN